MSRNEEPLASLFKAATHHDQPDHGAQFQHLCEMYWDALHANATTARLFLDDFVALLKDPDHLALAQNVIPSLRYGAPTSTDKLKARIQDQCQPASQHTASKEMYTEAHQLYAQELEIVQEVDMYRAAMLLCKRTNLSEAAERRLRKWLDDARFVGEEDE